MSVEEASQSHDCPVCGCRRTTSVLEASDNYFPLRRRWEIRECPLCQLAWTFPFQTAAQIREAYPEHYLGDTGKTLDEFESGKLQRSRSWRKETEKVRALEKRVASGRILDVGCAEGKFLWALDGERWDRRGVEVLSDVVAVVNRRMTDLKLISGDLWNASLDEESFDVITLWHVFEHLPEPLKTLRRLESLLRPGGRLFIALPNRDSLQASLFGRYWWALEVPRHLYHYSPASLRQLIGRTGLEVQEHCFHSYDTNFHTLKHSLIKWTDSRFGNRRLYYLLKPLLFLFHAVERLSRRYGAMLVVARKARGEAEKQA